jgi:alkylation response protein AidB-like acyl-CoA dehydrogenase
MSELTATELLRGSQFIYKNSDFQTTFIPENFDEEQEMVKKALSDFTENRILPNLKLIEKQDATIIAQLISEAGDLGLFGANIPEEYGGLNLDTNTNTIMTEGIGAAPSFSVTVAAHTGIGVLPVFYFGTAAQKAKYLPALASGQMKASYCLTEPNAGSDALSARTKAILTEDGSHYSITGQKMWITNAGFADIFIVFAKIDGKHFTGFIVERETAGLSFGAEEDKLGIKGSSTRQVFFENMLVPKENILGEIGKGHLIAFNVLNVGRFKLSAMALGFAKRNAKMAARYANERHQFGVSIGTFGAIKQKIAEQTISLFALESAVYRASALLQAKVKSLIAEGKTSDQAYLIAAEEYALECALLKVLGSETLFDICDHTVQIHGGNGFSEEYGAARDYRDNRINRIFEGTNEINRLLMFATLLRRLPKTIDEKLAVLQNCQPSTDTVEDLAEEETLNFEIEKAALQNLKSLACIFIAKLVNYEDQKILVLKDEQEMTTNVSDIMIDIFALESTLLRVQKMASQGKDISLETQILETLFADGLNRITKNAIELISSFPNDDDAEIHFEYLYDLASYKLVNVKNARRAIADHTLQQNA